MNQRAFFAAFGLTISSSFKASLGTRHRRPNRTQKLNQLRGRRRFPGWRGSERGGDLPLRQQGSLFATFPQAMHCSKIAWGDRTVKSVALKSRIRFLRARI